MRENNQLPVPASYDPNGFLQVHSIFPTIQGEGPFCGERALFFRLNGCNLRCPGCDTEYTAPSKWSAGVRAPFMASHAKSIGWAEGALIVITGGEPLRQNIAPAVQHLLEAGYRVQVETNGVLCRDDLPWDHPRFSVVCSPKTNRIHETIRQRAIAFKYVLQHGQVDEEDGLPKRALMHPAAPRVARPPAGALVYVQPMDEADATANALNLDATIRSAMTFGHRLQIQVHKIINME